MYWFIKDFSFNIVLFCVFRMFRGILLLISAVVLSVSAQIFVQPVVSLTWKFFNFFPPVELWKLFSIWIGTSFGSSRTRSSSCRWSSSMGISIATRTSKICQILCQPKNCSCISRQQLVQWHWKSRLQSRSWENWQKSNLQNLPQCRTHETLNLLALYFNCTCDSV